MPVENVNTISLLNSFYPAATDPLQEGDDHIRLLKSTLKNCFASIAGPVTGSHTEINSTVDAWKNSSAFSRTLQPLATAALWRSSLGLGSAAVEDVSFFALAAHTHVVADVIGAVPDTRTLTAQNGLAFWTGSAWATSVNLSANRTLGLQPSGVTAGTYGSTTSVATVTVDAEGRVTAAGNTPINFPAGAAGYTAPTGLNEIGTYAYGTKGYLNQSGGSGLTLGQTYDVDTLGLPTIGQGYPINFTGTWKLMGMHLSGLEDDGNGSTVYNWLFLCLKIS